MNDTDIQFDNEYEDSDFHIRSRKILGEPTTPTMINFLINKGVVKTEKQATVVLGASIVVFLMLSIFIIKSSISNSEELVVVNKFGQQIPFDEYVDMLGRGDDPLK